VIKASADGTHYFKLAKVTTPSWNVGEERLFTFTNPVAYSAYRIIFKRSDDSSFVAVCKIRFGWE
jgi:hypothetical protein